MTEDHPRIRGEHDPRGSAGDRRAWIIPAYAGSTQDRSDVPHAIPDHPRIRGEHSTYKIGTLKASGSSPHTRGARPRRHRQAQAERIIPAYAGSTIKGLWDGIKSGDHPRIRGEHLYGAVRLVFGGG